MRPRMILKVFKCMALLLINTLVCSSIAPSFSNGWNDLIKPHIEIGSSESRLLLKNCSLVVARGRKAWLTTYSPYRVSCPMTPLVRDANNQLGTKEEEYISKRKLESSKNLAQYLSRHAIPGYNSSLDILSDVSIALAFSGGGYRSMITGAGVLSAFDVRTPGSTLSNHLGGILQSSNYICGISGGSWLVMSNMANDFKPQYLALKDGQWDISEKLLEGIPNFDLKEIESDIEPEKLLGSTSNAPSREISDSIKAERVTSDHKYNKKSLIRNLLNAFNFSTKNSIIVSSSDPLEKALKPILQRERFNGTRKAELSSPLSSWKKVVDYYRDIHVEVRAKKISGFPISLTDYWGRALSRRIFPRAVRSPGVTLSSVTKLQSFKHHLQPFPIISTIEAAPETSFSSETSHIFEINPFEFGSWDSYLNSFVDIKYLGSSIVDGAPKIKDMCISGLDNLGFLTGTSSSLFNYIFIYLHQNLVERKVNSKSILQSILKSFGLRSNSKSWQYPHNQPDYALISPNPFLQRKVRGARDINKKENIYLTDGGGDGQNIPFHPLLLCPRKVDIIFVFDMSADLLNFPNGTSLVKSSQRYQSIWNRTPFFAINVNEELVEITKPRYKSVFPKVPTCEEFVDRGYTKKPFFMGCDLENDYSSVRMFDGSYHNVSCARNYTPPLIVYFANTDHSFPSNTSTFKMSYQDEEIRGMMQNGYNIATYKNGTIDENFSACLSCAILKRHFDRLNVLLPSFCVLCFKEYCYQQ